MTDRKDLDRVPVFKLGARYFHELLDTPNSYDGFGGYAVVVSQTENGLEFVQVSAFDPDADYDLTGRIRIAVPEGQSFEIVDDLVSPTIISRVSNRDPAGIAGEGAVSYETLRQSVGQTFGTYGCQIVDTESPSYGAAAVIRVVGNENGFASDTFEIKADGSSIWNINVDVTNFDTDSTVILGKDATAALEAVTKQQLDEGLALRQPRVVEVTTNTDGATAAKTATVEGYEPAAGDLILLTLELGSSSPTMTLSINGGTAYSILVGATPTLTFFIPNVLNCKLLLVFDGAAYYAHSLMNTNYTVMSESELIAGTGTTARTINAARLRYAFDNLLATIARSGSMSYLDKRKLDGIEANAEMNSVTSVNGKTGAVELYQTATTGTLISFASPKVFGSVATPETGNIDNDFTAAKLGIVQKIYHNNSTEPNFPAGWVKLGSGAYVTGTLNIIYCEWISGTRVEYWVTQ